MLSVGHSETKTFSARKQLQTRSRWLSGAPFERLNVHCGFYFTREIAASNELWLEAERGSRYQFAAAVSRRRLATTISDGMPKRTTMFA